MARNTLAFDLEQWFVGWCFEIGALQKSFDTLGWQLELWTQRSERGLFNLGQRVKVLIVINRLYWWVNLRWIAYLKFYFKSTPIAVKLNNQIEWHIINVLNKQKLDQVILREFYWLTQCGLNIKLTEHHRFDLIWFENL